MGSEEGEADSGTGQGVRPYSYMDLARLPGFRRLWLGDIASQASDRMALVAVTALAYGEGASALGLSVIIGAYFLPGVVLGIPGGIAADRFPRRTMMVAAEGVRVGIALALAAAGSGLWLIPTVLVFSSLTQLFYPSRQASIPCLVPGDALLAANAAISANLIIGFAIGPPLGGLVVSVAGAGWALVAAAAVMAVGVVIVSTIGDESICTPARTGGEGAGRVLREGLAALRGRTELWQGLVIVGFVMFAVGGGSVGLVILGDVELGMGDVGFSVLLAALAVGTLAGAVVIGGRPATSRKGRLVVAAAFLAGLLLPALTLVDDPYLACLVMFLVGVAAALVLVPFTTLLQERLGDHVLGTSFGVLSTGLTLPMVLGIAAAGPVIQELGVLNLFRVLGVVLLSVGVVALVTSELWGGEA